MKEREQVKIVSEDPPGYVLKYREDLLPGDRKYMAPPEPKKRKVEYDFLPE